MKNQAVCQTDKNHYISLSPSNIISKVVFNILSYSGLLTVVQSKND